MVKLIIFKCITHHVRKFQMLILILFRYSEKFCPSHVFIRSCKILWNRSERNFIAISALNVIKFQDVEIILSETGYKISKKKIYKKPAINSDL